ncbi:MULTISPECIES: hypothetical protein [Methylotenera]|uniref:hypothetical protein n=1 Tax=Methylotenera TaxID=359407 RepID=UPI001E52A776|nr:MULTISPECIES: hypothetical protein [Methylotenera]
MYFWKTHLLVDSLKQGSIEPNVLKNYYLASSLLYSVCYYLALLVPPTNSAALAIEAIGILTITVFGLNAVFKANGGSSGIGFLEKIVSISFPLFIKVFVSGIALGILLEILKALGFSKFQTEWLTSISVIFIQVIFFWRLAVHVKNTNA